jgi:hypothetical protein
LFWGVALGDFRIKIFSSWTTVNTFSNEMTLCVMRCAVRFKMVESRPEKIAESQPKQCPKTTKILMINDVGKGF